MARAKSGGEFLTMVALKPSTKKHLDRVQVELNCTYDRLILNLLSKSGNMSRGYELAKSGKGEYGNGK